MLPSLLHLHHLTLDPWSRNQGIFTQEGENTLPTTLGKAWGPHCGKKLNIRQVSKSTFAWDLQRSKKKHMPYFPFQFSQFPSERESRSVQMEKVMLPHCCVSEIRCVH